MKIAVWDIEGNNLYDYINKVWCIWVIDPIAKTKKGFKYDEIEECVTYLNEFDIHVGHNLLDFDVPALRKCGYSLRSGIKVVDTLIMSRFMEPDLRGGHSLKAWGKRLGNEKDNYGEETVNAWDAYSDAMYWYCLQDVEVTVDLYFHLCKELGINPEDPEAYCEI